MKKPYIFAITTVLIWSTLSATAKTILDSLPSFQTLAVSSLYAFIFLLICNVLNGSIKYFKIYKAGDMLKISALGFLGLFMYSALYYYGLSVLTSQEACILNYLWPVMLVLFSCLILKEEFSVKKAAAMLMSFAGIVLMTLGGSSLKTGSAAGMASCILAAACYGLFSVLNKKAAYNQSFSMMLIWLVTAVCAFAASRLTEAWQSISAAQHIGLLWLGIAIDGAAYLLWALAVNGADDSAKIANLAYLTPFLSIVISAVFLKENISIYALASLILIVGGILLQSINVHKIKHSA